MFVVSRRHCELPHWCGIGSAVFYRAIWHSVELLSTALYVKIKGYCRVFYVRSTF